MLRLFSVHKFIVFFIIFITIFFLLPLFINGFSYDVINLVFYNNSNGFSSSLLRTFSFAFSSAIINVGGGFLLALLLNNVSLFSNLGKQLSFFILPITLGNIAVVFVFKILLFDSTFFNVIVKGGLLSQNLVLILIQFWQFGFLFAYLFWLNLQSTPKRVESYSSLIGLSNFEKFRDILLPNARNLIILLLFIGFIFSFYEDAKSQFIFKASQGTGTELINHWLNRTYTSNSIINPIYATKSIFKIGIIVFILTFLSFIFMGALALNFVKILSKLNSRNKVIIYRKDINYQNVKSLFKVSFCIAIIVIPVIVALFKSRFHFAESLPSIIFPFVLTLLAAFVSTIFSIIFGIASRLAYRSWLTNFNSKSLFFFLTIFLLLIIPPICIVLCSFKWLSVIGYNSDLIIYIVWILGHCFLTFPLLGSFVVATHFSVNENEINYLSAYQISNISIVRYSFVKRFRADYLFTFLFALTFVWNDACLNMVLSDKIPSFASNLQMLLIGRAADYSKATSFVLVALILSSSCIFIWQKIIGKQTKLKEV